MRVACLHKALPIVVGVDFALLLFADLLVHDLVACKMVVKVILTGFLAINDSFHAFLLNNLFQHLGLLLHVNLSKNSL